MRRVWIVGVWLVIGVLLWARPVITQGPFRVFGTGASGAAVAIGATAGALNVSVAGSPTFTGVVTANNSGIAVTSTDGAVIANLTAATAGVPVQQSPRLRFRSNVWNTTATAATNTDDWFIESVPVSGVTPSGLLKFGKSLNGAGTTFPMTLTSAGLMTLLSGMSIPGSITLSGTTTSGELRFINHIFQVGTSTGLSQFLNADRSAGVGLDVATDAILKVRTRAQSAYALVQAGYITAGTTPSVANVGANSCGTTSAIIAGNDNSFEITVGATAGTQCRVTLTTTAPVRWNCNGNNDTTVANLVSAKSISTTQVDFYGTFVAGDVITGQCLPR